MKYHEVETTAIFEKWAKWFEAYFSMTDEDPKTLSIVNADRKAEMAFCFTWRSGEGVYPGNWELTRDVPWDLQEHIRRVVKVIRRSASFHGLPDPPDPQDMKLFEAVYTVKKRIVVLATDEKDAEEFLQMDEEILDCEDFGEILPSSQNVEKLCPFDGR